MYTNGLWIIDVKYQMFEWGALWGNPDLGMASAFMCGDANGDGQVDIADVVYLINYLFVGGPEPLPILSVGDANGDGTVDIADVIYVINHLFTGGPPPGC